MKRAISVLLAMALGVLCMCGIVLAAGPASAVGSGGNGKIVFLHLDNGTHFQVINPDGTGRQALASDLVGGNMPMWSPDGTKVAYTNPTYGISIMNADGTNRVAITPPANVLEVDPTWSPDGSKLAFLGLVNNPDGSRTQEVWTMNVDGSNQAPITSYDTNQAIPDNPAWSPDGSKIAFDLFQRVGSGVEYYITTVNPDGTGLHNLTSDLGTYAFPSWSPDGTEIAYTHHGINIMNADGTGSHVITPPSPYFDANSDWSPDGKQIVFGSARQNPPYTQDIFVINVDGSGLHNLTSDGNNSNPRWQAVKSSDTTPPTVTVTGVTSGATYGSNHAPTPGCTSTDADSGVATNATVAVTNSGTSYTATCSGAVDNAGNTAAPVSASYTVSTQPSATATVVNSTGAPLSGVPVTFRPSSGSTTSATTDSSGNATTALAPGTYTVTATYATGSVSQQLVVTTTGANTVNFATVAATVTINDPTTSDIASATVTHAGNSGTFGSKTAVNSAGQVSFEVFPGTNSFTAYVAGGYQTQTVTVAAGGPASVTFSTTSVTVNVSDPSASDIAAATVTHAGNTGTFGPKTAVNSAGQVVFQALPGTSTFTAYVAGGYQSQAITVSAGGSNVVNFATVAVTVTVVDSSGNPRTNATVSRAGNTGTFGPKVAVDGNGQLVVQALPGTSTFTAWVGSTYKTQSATITAATSLSITV